MHKVHESHGREATLHRTIFMPLIQSSSLLRLSISYAFRHLSTIILTTARHAAIVVGKTVWHHCRRACLGQLIIIEIYYELIVVVALHGGLSEYFLAAEVINRRLISRVARDAYHGATGDCIAGHTQIIAPMTRLMALELSDTMLLIAHATFQFTLLFQDVLQHLALFSCLEAGLLVGRLHDA